MTLLTRVAVLPLLASALACGTPARFDVGRHSWSEVRGSVFTLRSDARPDLVAQLALDLERFAAIVRATADVEIGPPQRPLRVYALADRELMHAIGVGSTLGVPGIHSEKAHASITLSDVSRYRDSSRQTLYHEFVHFLLFRSGAYVPRWYHEGLADFLATVRVRENLVTLGRPTRLGQLASLDSVRLPDVISAHAYPKTWDEIARFYATSWLFVHFVHTQASRNGEPLRLQAVEYLTRLARGEDEDLAFATAFGAAPGSFEPALAAYGRSLLAGHVALVHMDATELSIGDPGPIGVASPADVASDLAEVLLGYDHGAATEAATHLLESALAVDPEHDEARATLAWAKARRFRPPAGQAEIARALARGHGNARVHLQAARFHLARARWGSDLDRGELERARRHFHRAAAADPGLAAAWSELGQTYAIDDADPEPRGPGIEALERALELAPADASVHLALGKLLLRADEREAASLHLQLVLRWSWSDDEREAAEEALAALPD